MSCACRRAASMLDAGRVGVTMHAFSAGLLWYSGWTISCVWHRGDDIERSIGPAWRGESGLVAQRFFRRFIDGDLGLATTYWLCAAVPSVFAKIAMRAVASDAIAYSIGTALVIYQMLLVRALWCAGKKYRGRRIWPALALVMIVLALFRNLGVVLAM